MRRKIGYIFLSAAVLLLTACGQAAVAETTAPGRPAVVLDVVTSYGKDDGNRKNFENAVRSFEDSTGYRVWDRSSVSNEEWKTKVLTDFMTGSEPDVLFYFSNADAAPFINAGRVVSIEEIREQYPDYATNMRQSLIAQAQDGKHYAVPSTGYWEGMYVNKAVLEQCGISVPEPDYTWDAFLADCEAIKNQGYTPIACSLFEIPHYWFEFMVLNNGSVYNHLEVPEVDRDGNLKDSEAADKWIAALEDMKQLYDAGFFPANTLTATDGETTAMFAEGQAAFLLDGSWKLGYFMEYYPEKLDDYVVSFVPGKGNRKATETVGGISMGYFITRKAWENPAKREAAVQFVFHMTSEEVLSTFVTAEMTALNTDIEPTGLNVIQKSALDAFNQVTEITAAVQDSISGDAKRALFSTLSKVVTGAITPARAVETAMKLN